MQFRIKHILFATVLVALFAWGLVEPSPDKEGIFRLGTWLAVVVLIGRAIAGPQAERKAISAGLVAAISYLAFALWLKHPVTLPTSFLLQKLYPPLVAVSNHFFEPNPGASSFQIVGHIAFATFFGLIVAGLTAYWTKCSNRLFVKESDDSTVDNG
jgi:hypothetical protein